MFEIGRLISTAITALYLNFSDVLLALVSYGLGASTLIGAGALSINKYAYKINALDRKKRYLEVDKIFESSPRLAALQRPYLLKESLSVNINIESADEKDQGSARMIMTASYTIRNSSHHPIVYRVSTDVGPDIESELIVYRSEDASVGAESMNDARLAPSTTTNTSFIQLDPFAVVNIILKTNIKGTRPFTHFIKQATPVLGGADINISCSSEIKFDLFVSGPESEKQNYGETLQKKIQKIRVSDVLLPGDLIVILAK